MARYSRALDAKPGKGGITADGIAAITDSVADVPDLLAEIERLREHATNDVEFRASVIDALLDALGITDDTTPEDARQILDGCSCDGEEGTLHLVWHLGQKVERLTRWKAEAMVVMDGLQELGEALGMPLGARITGPDALAEVRRLRDLTDQDALTREAIRLAAGSGSSIETIVAAFKEMRDNEWMRRALQHRARAEAAEAALARVRTIAVEMQDLQRRRSTRLAGRRMIDAIGIEP